MVRRPVCRRRSTGCRRAFVRRRRQSSTQRAGSPDHQGVVAEVSPYRYADADELLAGEHPLLVALDEVTDPHNLGAVARVAECAGADGLVITGPPLGPGHRRRYAGSRRARSSISPLPASRTWPTCCSPPSARASGATRPRPSRRLRMTGLDYRDGAVFVLGAEGRGLRRRVRAACDQAVAIPMRGAGRVAQRLDRRGGAALRGGAAARWRLSSTSSTATTSATCAAAARTTSARGSSWWPRSPATWPRAASTRSSCSTATAAGARSAAPSSRTPVARRPTR